MNASHPAAHWPPAENPLRGHTPFEPVRGSDLPVYRSTPSQLHAAEVWYYAPGYLAVVDADQAEAFERNVIALEAHGWHAAELRRHAAEAQQRWTEARA